MTYIQQVLRVIVAQICQTIGWHSIQTTPLELLVDILHKYLQEITRDAYRHTELYNRTEPNLDDIGLCFRNLNINLSEIEEYINYVQPISCPIDIPKFPVHKDSNLNFLKPGSNEVLTRPVHINEHLPPIYPEKEIKQQLSETDLYNDTDIICETKNSTILSNGKLQQNSENDDTIFKRPELQDSLTTNLNGNITVLSTSLLPSSSGLTSINFNGNSKKTRLFEEEGRPTREMSSVMMTSSGFISPAREGKLPDSKPPVLQEYRPVRTPSPKLTSNITSINNSNFDNNNPSTSSSVLGNSNLGTNNSTVSSATKQIPTTSSHLLNQNNKKELNNLDAKLLKKLKKKSNNIDKEQRKRDKLSGKLLSSATSSSATTKPLSKNKLLKQLQKQQQLQQQQQLKSKYNVNKDKLTKKQKQKLKQQREFNMENHNNIIKNLTLLQHNKNNLNYQNNSNNMKDAITLLQQSAAIAAATGIPLANIHQPSALQQQPQFLLQQQQQQNFPLHNQQNLSTLTNNRFNADIKLSTEPDKNKLNIFKKISSSGIKKEHKDDVKTAVPQNVYTNEQQLISLPTGTTITPTNIQSNINSNNNPILPINNDKKYPLINDSDQIICVDDEEKVNLPTTSTFLQLQEMQSNNNVNAENNRSAIQHQQQFNLTKSQTKIPKKLKKKYLQMDEQPLNLSNDKPLFNNIENLSFKQQLKMLNTKGIENYLKQQHQQISGKTVKEKKERIKKTKIKENKVNKNATSSTVAQQFLQAVTAAAAAASSATGGSTSGINNHLLYPPDIRSTDNLAAINKKLMKIDTVMQPTPTINKLLSTTAITDDLHNINKMNTQKSSIPSTSNVNPAAVAAANFFSKQYLSGGPMGSYIPQLFPFPLTFQARPGLIPPSGLFPPLPPPPQPHSTSSSTITGVGDNKSGFNDFLPMNMNFPMSNNNLIGNNLNINNKIDNLSSSSPLNSNNNKNINNYLDNKSDINLSNKVPPIQFSENKNYSNVAPLVPESMIQNYQLTKTKQSKLNKQQQQQTFIPSNLLPQSSNSTSLVTNLDYLNKNYNQSINLPLNKFHNDDIPIEISDDEKIKSDDDNHQQQIKNSLNADHLLKIITKQELNNEQQQNIINTNPPYQIDNKYNINDNDKNFNYNNKNINENRTIESNNEIFSSDHDGGNTDYNIGGDSGGGSSGKFDKQQRKEHKKGKKIKEGKIKKKKDKKDKIKNKEKYEKKQRIKDELNFAIRKDKEKSKKLKKEKKKDKQRLNTNPLLPQETQLFDELSHKSQLKDLNKIPNNDNNGDESSAGDNTPHSGATTSSSTSSSSAVPKLTLKLGIGKSPTPDSMESRKIIIKSTGNEQQHLMIGSGAGPMDYNYRRDPSPELARISPLVTRPPKQKSKEKDKNSEIESPSSTTTNISSTMSSGHYVPNVSGNPTNITVGNISNIPTIPGNISIPSQLPQSIHCNPVVARGPGRPKGSGNKSSSVIHNQPHHGTGGIGGIGSTIVSGLDLNEQQSSNIIHPPITSSTAHQPTTLLNTTDADGNQVWICPACGRVDDGTPMIGCDGCDAWYHWVCVGIQVPPDDNEDWYCRVCITKKQDVYESDKKKKRKKKNKTN